MKKATDYRNIVFDLGGVLAEYNPDNVTWHLTNDREIVREIHNVLFCSMEWMSLDFGSITDDEAIQRILPRLSSDKVRGIARTAFYHWHEFNNVPREGVDSIIRTLKGRGQKVYILSNASKRLTDTYKDAVPAPELYDGAFFSGEVLALKPQPIIYRMFFERFGLKPEECLFIDDSEANVESSIRCGMDAWWFTTGKAEDLAKFLEV